MRRLFVAFICVAFLASSVALIGPLAANASAACKATQFIGIRGSSEPPGFGNTVGNVAAGFGSSTSKYALPYPAAPTPYINVGASLTAFVNSVNSGVATLDMHLRHQATACPSQKFVLAGYSQGALVASKYLSTAPSNILSHIQGVALFGNPMFLPGKGYDIGTYSANREGVVPELLPWIANDYVYPPALASRTQDYCIAGDPVCNYGIINLYQCTRVSDIGLCAHQLYVADGYTSRSIAFLKS